jgi:hypothetical protein
MCFQKKSAPFLIIVLVFFALTSKAVHIENSAIAEQESVQLYFNKSWSKLIEYGESAIKQGYDYYYMRVRVGVAYYEQKKYIKAIKHFEKALKFNSVNPVALEYLYYSYVFSGRANEARALKSCFSEDMEKYIKTPKNKILESVYAEGGYTVTNLNSQFSTIDIDDSYNIYGEATIMKDMTYFNVSLNHQLTNKLTVFQGYSNIGIDFSRDIKINNKDTIDNYKLAQHDYYMSAIMQLSHFTISPAFHFINVSFGKLNAQYDSQNSKYIFSKKDTSFVNYATSLSISKSIGIFTYGLTGGFSQLNGMSQIQVGGSLTYFPFGTTNFYGTSTLVYLNENSTNRLIESQKLGVKVFPKLWAEGAMTYGNLQNYAGDKILYKCGVALLSTISKHIELSLRYDCFNRENTYYSMNSSFQIESVHVDYKTQSIIGGLKWML